ncbi:unnamed protein product [Euphydryas editha]|uniref:Retrovirus-related Pol polyprotein from transposon TNT 1-94 n=1 Tax=Euphydryas editha TaxID=104508 RepID=A0AAU9V0C6_EUPED|nr:unnamed protein product [Euphydryas editha]
MSSGGYIVNVPKLKGRENYDDWAFAAKNFLILEGIDVEQIPNTLSAAEDKKAMAKLIMTIDPTLFVHIKTQTNVGDLWNKLKKLFDDSGFTRKISLLRTLISIRLENSESMTSYVNQMVETAQRLRGTGFEIDDEWVGSLLLAGLPAKFSPMIMAIEHSGIKISADVIKTKLLDMSSEIGSTDGTDSALWSKHRTRSGNTKHQVLNVKKPVSKEKQIKCYKCKKFGHYKNQCTEMKEKQMNAFSAAFFNGKFSMDDWYVDSGASAHMTANKNILSKIKEIEGKKEIITANQMTVKVLCAGETQITTKVNNSQFDILVNKVLCIPNLTTNLLSVSQLIASGNKVLFKKNICHIRNQNNVLVGVAVLENGVYKLSTVKSENLLMAAVAADARLWHRRLGHINSYDLQEMSNGAVTGVTINNKADITKSNCIVCCEGKFSRLPFLHKGTRRNELLELVHSDVSGPMETRSIGQSRYFLTFVDDASRMCFVYFLKEKNQVLKYFKEFQVMVENQTGAKIKTLRTDNGGEYTSSEMETYLKSIGLVHQKTNSHTPEQNGLCERLNRTIVERARCLLFDAKLDKSLWAEAVNTAVYLRNRSPASGLSQMTPYERWTGKKPDLEHVRIFGSPAMVYVPKINRKKWDKKAVRYILVGYAENIKGYRLYNQVTKKVITSRDVIVMEENESQEAQIVIPEENIQQVEEGPESEEESTLIDPTDPSYVCEGSSACSTEDDSYQSLLEDDKENLLQDVESLGKRERKTPNRYGFTNLCVLDENQLYGEDITYLEAMNGPESEEWKQAMRDEIKAFEDNQAWELVDRTEADRVVQCKWVFKKKFESDNKVRFRARLVAKGFTQKEGVDYKETFSPVLRYSTLRLLFALSVKFNFEITHFDVTTAFLNGFLDENVYMQVPCNLKCKENSVLKLKRAIYGLKQSARAWNKRIDDCLLKLNFVKSKLEPCLYSKKCKKGQIIVAVFVDDFFIFSTCKDLTEELRKNLESKFKIKDLGRLQHCLGMQVKYCDNCISIDQEKFVEKILDKFHMSNCKSVDTPMEINLKLDKAKTISKQYPYQQLIGSLMYLSVLTRPDISYAICYLSQFNNSYNETHWKHAKRVLKYLKKTKNYGLVFSKDENLSNIHVEGFVDADWGSDIIDRKSFSGFCFKLSNSLISYECRKQRCVALSSTEAEYISISEASKEAMYLKNLIIELTGMCEPILLFNDSQSAQKLVSNAVFHRRSKHIDIRYHFVREAVSNKFIKVAYLETAEMPADIFTKSLGSVKHFYLIKKLGILPIS